MKPLYITIKNYKSYGDYETTIDLSSESVQLIVGKTGSGKTSFIDAMIWCLYGKSTCNTDDVVNRNTKKDCKVEFSFFIDKDEYTITRYRKHSDHNNDVLLFKNKKNITPTKKTDVNNLLEDVTGITKNAMISSVIFSSEIYISFMRSRGLSDRLKIFENILNLKMVNKWAEELKKLKMPIQERYAKAENTIDKIDYGINSINENIKDYKEKIKENLITLKEEKESKNKEIEDIKNELEEINKIDVSEELEKSIEYEKANDHNREIEDEINEIEIINLEEIIAKFNLINSKILESKEIIKNNNIEEIEKNLKNKEELKKAKEKINLLRSQAIDTNKIEKEINKLNKEINEIEEHNQCPTCHQTLQESEELKEEFQTKLQTREKELQEAEQKNLSINNEIEDINEKVERIEILPITYTVEEIQSIEHSLSLNQERKEELEKEIERAKKSNEFSENKINKLKEKIIDVKDIPKYDKEYLQDLSDRIKVLKEREVELNNEINIIDGKAKSLYDKSYVEGLNEKIEKLKKEKEKTIKSKSKLEVDLEHYDYMLSLFSNKNEGIKKEIIGRMINVFNNKVNYFLPIFFSEEKDIVEVKFDKNLNDTIIINNEEVSFDTFSSGEKTRMEIAVAFSLFSLVKMFFSSSASFVVFDEILDGNLDEGSLDKVLNVVEDYGKSNSVLVISHRKELIDRFSNHIEISKDKYGYSKIIEE